MGPFSSIIKIIKLDGDALPDPEIAQVSATEAECVGAGPLDGEGCTPPPPEVKVGWTWKWKLVWKEATSSACFKKALACLAEAAVGQVKVRAAEVRESIQCQQGARAPLNPPPK